MSGTAGRSISDDPAGQPAEIVAGVESSSPLAIVIAIEQIEAEERRSAPPTI
jgi:hypothetical protein